MLTSYVQMQMLMHDAADADDARFVAHSSTHVVAHPRPSDVLMPFFMCTAVVGLSK